MIIGYSRTSTTIAGLEAQDRELKAAGVVCVMRHSAGLEAQDRELKAAGVVCVMRHSSVTQAITESGQLDFPQGLLS